MAQISCASAGWERPVKTFSGPYKRADYIGPARDGKERLPCPFNPFDPDVPDTAECRIRYGRRQYGDEARRQGRFLSKGARTEVAGEQPEIQGWTTESR